MTYHIIVNPAGASGNTIKLWNRTEPLFRELNTDYIVHFSTPEDDIETICSRLTSRGEETHIVVVGGDGSMYYAVNGIKDFARTKISLIPSGSGNDLARDLGYEKSTEAVVRRLLTSPEERLIDLGRITFHDQYSIVEQMTGRITDINKDEELTRLYNISAGFGFDAGVCAEALGGGMKAALNKMNMGKLLYLVEAVKLIRRSETHPVTMEYMDRHTERYEKLLFAAGMNHSYEGGGFRFCAKADDQDGSLDLCIADSLSRKDICVQLPKAYSGKELIHPGIHIKRTQGVTISCDEPLWVHTDGEVACRSKSITLTVHDRKLRFVK